MSATSKPTQNKSRVSEITSSAIAEGKSLIVNGICITLNVTRTTLALASKCLEKADNKVDDIYQKIKKW